MNVGISTACLYPDATEISMQKLINAGFKTFEIFFNSPCELENEFILYIKDISSKNNCKIKAIHPFSCGMEPLMLFSNYYRRFEDSLKFYEKYFYIASILGAKIVVIHGGKNNLASSIPAEEYFERFFKLSLIADKYSVILAHENVNLFACQHPDFILKMNDALKDKAKYVFDIKQAVRAGHNPLEICEAMGKNIVHVHINDNNSNNDCLPPGQGDMDYLKIKSMLKNFNYNGDLIIEVYRNSFQDLSDLIKSKEYLIKIFK